MRYASQQDSLAGLEEDRRGSLPRGGRRWTGSLSQRGRASRGLPQAVFKISSYSHSAGAVWDRVNYVARDGEIEVEGPNGELLDQEQLEEMVDDWDALTKEGQGRRFAMSAVVSFPKGVDEEKASEAARQFFREAFADNHDYVFAPHTDAKQFHVHVVVQARGHDGKQIRLNRDDIQDLRMLLAEKAREQGIELDASPRWARGLDTERRPGREAEGIRRRGETPRRETGEAWKPGQEQETRGADRAGAGEAWNPEKELREAGRLSLDRRMQLEALVAVRRQRWERREKVAADEYVEAAELLARKAGELGNDKGKVVALKGAAELAGAGLEAVRSAPNFSNREAAQGRVSVLVTSIERVDTSINSQIRGLGEGGAQREAITARRGLAEKISQYHQGAREQAGQERTGGQESAGAERARGAEGRGEAAGAGRACQALEYARAAAGVAGQINKLTNDQDRVAAVKEVVGLGRFGWDLAQKDKGTAEDREEARGIINRAERALRFAINRIEDPQGKREAIQARQTLYNAGVKEYREAKQETERQRRQEAERAAERGRGETAGRETGEAWNPEKELREAGRLSPDRRMQLEALVAVRRGRWERREKVAADEYVEAAELLARKIGELGTDKEKVEAVKGAAELAGRGLELVSSFQLPGLVSSIERVDKSISSQIGELGSGAEQDAAITARRGLAEKISQYHQGAREQAGRERAGGQESGRPERARGAEGRGESAGASAAAQALEYARSAAGVAGQINKLTNDQDRVAAVKEVVGLARSGWDLAEKAGGLPEEQEQARGIINRAERALRFAINRIEDPQGKREAIQARQTLYNAGVKEYREALRETERQRRQEAEREEGPERGR